MPRSFGQLREDDPRSLPSYSIPDAARYLLVPPATVRSWVAGRPYPTQSGVRRFSPVIAPADSKKLILSFVNLVEIHVLSAVRKEHNVRLLHVRSAIDYLKRHFASPHPLADQRLASDGVDLFVEKFGQLINISQSGQLGIREFLLAHLKRVEWDARGIPFRLYPFTRAAVPEAPKTVMIDPLIAFGRPVLVGTGIPTTVIAERYKAGESIEDLAEDYGRSHQEIQEAIRCELFLHAA
ncbi:MAG: DUF433 domain-containing protein [Candidatus Eisenbacteria bacterium]|nr:DUF433 domain-containing protein [Candidatus Eisenbacteria bacterium]